MKADKKDQETVAKEYEELLPNSIDILLLGIGEDGHIASLFPNSPQVHEQKRLCLPITGPKLPYNRLTVTQTVKKNAKTTYILAADRSKSKIVEQAKQTPIDINKLPVQMEENPIWCYN